MIHRSLRPLGALVVVASLGTSPLFAQGMRTINGWGNNPLNPDWGQAGTELMRHSNADYADGVSAPSGATRKSARDISNIVCSQFAPREIAAPVTSFVWQWGQFVDHDLDLSDTAAPAEPFPILVPFLDPWFDPHGTGMKTIAVSRSEWTGGTSLLDPREQMNAITGWLDGSMIYGSNVVRARALRVFGRSGNLRTSAGGMLPYNDTLMPNAPAPMPELFLAGDVRANEQIGLIAMHTLFMREHNSVCEMLQKRFPRLHGERLFQFARILVGAEIQVITYRDWLPILVGADALAPYTGYDMTVEPSIANEFSTAAFRFGHTMLPPELLRLAADGSSIPEGPIALRDAFFNPKVVTEEGGIDPILRGLAHQRPQAIDPQIIDEVRNFLFGPPGSGGFDLASLNIQRGRDHGLPSYNQLRVSMGLAPKATFAEVTGDPIRAWRLAQAYPSPDHMDAWVGCLAEDAVPGALVGELTRTILVDQFERLRDGDRFWYQMLAPQWAHWAEQQTLAKVIRRNTGIGAELQDDVFIRH